MMGDFCSGAKSPNAYELTTFSNVLLREFKKFLLTAVLSIYPRTDHAKNRKNREFGLQ